MFLLHVWERILQGSTCCVSHQVLGGAAAVFFVFWGRGAGALVHEHTMHGKSITSVFFSAQCRVAGITCQLEPQVPS